jgi:hypothetical protein
MPDLITKMPYLRTMAEPLGSFEAVLPLKKAMAEPHSWATLASSPIGGLCDLRLPPKSSYLPSYLKMQQTLQQRILSTHASSYKNFVDSRNEQAACVEWLLDNS